MPQRVKPAEQGIVLDALSAGYGQTLIVDDINLTIPTGKMTVLAGAKRIRQIHAALDYRQNAETARRLRASGRASHSPDADEDRLAAAGHPPAIAVDPGRIDRFRAGLARALPVAGTDAPVVRGR
ncbi:ferric enterobactin transporter ATP-binding protein [Klebsiella pneumoniae]|nr:ferric enterobactin transporter ATP-binding protein [Klebsiella pneumoniae]